MKRDGCPIGKKRNKKGKCVTDINKQFKGTVDAESGEKFDVYELVPLSAPAQTLTQEDVFGRVIESHWKNNVPNTEWIPTKRISKGMVVASQAKGYPNICPIWKDKIPYKSVTVVCPEEFEGDCEYWLEFVHGGGSISRRKKLPGGKIALRSDYQAW